MVRNKARESNSMISAEKSAGREFNSRPRLQNFLTYLLSISSLSHFPYPLCFSNGLCVHVQRCFETLNGRKESERSVGAHAFPNVSGRNEARYERNACNFRKFLAPFAMDSDSFSRCVLVRDCLFQRQESPVSEFRGSR